MQVERCSRVKVPRSRNTSKPMADKLDDPVAVVPRAESSDKAASTARATKKRKSTERMRMAELANAIEDAFSTQIAEADAVHDVRGYVDETKLPKRIHASPPARELDNTPNDGSPVNGDDSDCDQTKVGLHLRKRTKRGRDFTLKRAMILIEHLKSKHAQLAARIQVQSSQPPRPSLALAASLEYKPFDPVPSSATFLQHLHEQAFYQCPESRLLCRLSLLDHQHTVVDCNDAWASAMGRSRTELIGRRLSDLYCPASVHRFELNVQLSLHHQVLVTRNMLSVESGLVVDMLSWVDPSPGPVSDAVYAAETMRDDASANSEQPVVESEHAPARYLQLVHLNARPWKSPDCSPASVLGLPELKSISPASSECASQMVIHGDTALRPVSATGLPGWPSSHYGAMAHDERQWECQAAALTPMQLVSSADPSHTRADMDYMQGRRCAQAGGYPECTIFMPMDLPDMPQADLYLLPWNHASSALSGGVPGFARLTSTPSISSSSLASQVDAFPASVTASNTCELLDLSYSPALTSLQRSVVAKAYMRSSSVPDTEVTRLLSPCVTNRLPTVPRYNVAEVP